MLRVRQYLVDSCGVISGAEIEDVSTGLSVLSNKSAFNRIGKQVLQNAFIDARGVLKAKNGHEIDRVSQEHWMSMHGLSSKDVWKDGDVVDVPNVAPVEQRQFGRAANRNRTSREGVTGYLKWGNTVIGEIIGHQRVRFVRYELELTEEQVVSQIRGVNSHWDKEQFEMFLRDRIISENRDDIAILLRSMNMSCYDPFAIAERTSAFNPKDLFWVCESEHLEMDYVLGIQGVKSLFQPKTDSVVSPEGIHRKHYGKFGTALGLYKHGIDGEAREIKAEKAFFEIAKLLGVGTCRVHLKDSSTIFSQFNYNPGEQYVVHMGHFLRNEDKPSSSLYTRMVNCFPWMEKDIARMCLLDFVTRQTRRRVENTAVIYDSPRARMYPLFDNGNSLFAGQSDLEIEGTQKDIERYVTKFGKEETYLEVISKISEQHNIADLIDLKVGMFDVRKALGRARMSEEQERNSFNWVRAALETLDKMSKHRKTVIHNI